MSKYPGGATRQLRMQNEELDWSWWAFLLMDCRGGCLQDTRPADLKKKMLTRQIVTCFGAYARPARMDPRNCVACYCIPS